MMIKFFRRIRKSLLSENPPERDGSVRAGKFSNYILYAIGEIILVVIGILIALQINNQNQERKDAQLEQHYLLALQEEFNLNLGKLKQLDTLLTAQLNAANELIQNMHPDKIRLDDQRISYLIAQGFRDTYNYFPSSGVMKDLINSGKLGLIKNPVLRRTLADWDSNIVQLKEFENESKEASLQVVEILRTRGNFRTQLDAAFATLGVGPSHFKNTNAGLLQNEEFESSIVYFNAITWRLKNVFYPEQREKMKHVLALIKTELDYP